VAGPCERSKEAVGSIKCGELLEELSACQLTRKMLLHGFSLVNYLFNKINLLELVVNEKILFSLAKS
jgi:hypothetical protein